MTVTPNVVHRRCMHRASILLTITLVTLAASVASSGAATVAPNYTSGPLTYANGTPLGSCRSWSGDADDRGHFYAACPVRRDLNGDGTGDINTPALYEFDSLGRVVTLGYLPSEYYFDDTYRMRDVAVSPDGNVAYVSVGPLFDDLGQHPENNYATGQPMPNGAKSGSVLRLARQSNGTWAHDPSWRAGPFRLGTHYWAARNVDVDASGRIYAAVNGYVFELSPTTGAIVTAFGGATTNGVGGAWIDGIDVAQGIAVAADGGSLYVVEQKYHLVQRWIRVGATDWKRDTGFLLGRAGEEGEGLCASNDHFQSPYDVGVDAAGDVYVMDVTCNRIQRFTKAGAYVQTVWSNHGRELNHGLAVNREGSIMLPDLELRLGRTDPAVKPVVAQPVGGGGPTPARAPGAPGCRDVKPPTLTSVAAVRRSATRQVIISARATDDCSGVAQIRITGARAGAARWAAGTSQAIPLTGWNGPRSIVVQVRDGAGRTSTRAVQVTITLALPQPALVARTAVSVRGSGCSAVAPLRRVGGSAGYRLVDRCARIAGRVVRSRRTGGGISVEVLVPTTTARAIYANAVGPVRIWFVTDRRTRTVRAARAGRAVVVVGSLIAQRSLAATFLMPVDVVAGA